MDTRIQRLAATIAILVISTLNAQAADVPHVSGGIGYEGREEMQAAEKDHNLKVVAAEKTGDYLADVKVVIESAKRERMLETTMQGPILLAKLPPGTYTVTATFEGTVQTRTVTVPATGLRSVDFRWTARPN